MGKISKRLVADKKRALLKAIELAGNQSELARLLSKEMGINIIQQNVYVWKSCGYLPSKYVIPVERALKKKITRYELRPDLYPND